MAAAFLTVVILREAIGVVLFALAAVAYLLATGLGRAIIAQRGWLPRWTGPSTPSHSGRTDLRARCNDHPHGQSGQLGFAGDVLIERDPVDIVSFTELQILVQRHRAEMQGESR